MKRVIIALLTLFAAAGINLPAQSKFGADSAECIKYLSYYQEYYKQKSYSDALVNWRKAYEVCPPTASQNMLIHGTTLLRQVIAKNMRNVVYKEALLDSLLVLSDLRVEYYPKYAVAALNAKGQDIYNYAKNDTRKVFDGMEAIIAANKEETKVSFFQYDMKAALDLFQDGALDSEQIINLYTRNVELIDAAPARTDAEKTQKDEVKKNVETLFATSKVASCDELIRLFTPRFDADPENVELATLIAKMLGQTEGCIDNVLFKNALTVMHKNNPTHNSAYLLYKLNVSQGNNAEAFAYLEEAIAYPESDDEQDADYLYELATAYFKNGQLAKAFAACRKVTELDHDQDKTGKAYMLMGQIWGAVSCGGNEVEARAHFWVACDYLNKAVAADASLADEARRLSGNYSIYFPNTGDAFMYGLVKGQSYSVSCAGMSAVTTVRTKD
ncbi:MAG: tetratricopeptide repeat protein [Bacteroidales bacterium]|nr:tetratricopeptide repeat protein [Bacteroidales bacterium]MBO4446524.1 tetratricopeptide repeat protein [Bacteroidales bacterium]